MSFSNLVFLFYNSYQKKTKIPNQVYKEHTVIKRPALISLYKIFIIRTRAIKVALPISAALLQAARRVYFVALDVSEAAAAAHGDYGK